MIRIKIGDAERELDSADESWVNQQINKRRADGLTVCVKVVIKEGDVNMILATPTCADSGCSGRPPRPHEKMIFELWTQRGLDDGSFTGGNLIAFLKQLRHVL